MIDMIMPEKGWTRFTVGDFSHRHPCTWIVLTSGYGDTYLRLGMGVAKFHGADRVSILKKPIFGVLN